MGDSNRPWTLADLEAVPEPLGAVGLEIPMREICGELTSCWAHLLVEMRRRDRGRLRFGLCLAVQGDGGLDGVMLTGSCAFVDRAAEWFGARAAT